MKKQLAPAYVQVLPHYNPFRHTSFMQGAGVCFCFRKPFYMENADKYLRKQKSVSKVQYVDLRRWGYLPDEIEQITQGTFTQIADALRNGVSAKSKPLTNLQARFFQIYKLSGAEELTDDQARQAITNYLLVNPTEDAAFILNFEVWKKNKKTKGTLYGPVDEKSPIQIPIPVYSSAKSLAKAVAKLPEKTSVPIPAPTPAEIDYNVEREETDEEYEARKVYMATLTTEELKTYLAKRRAKYEQ